MDILKRQLSPLLEEQLKRGKSILLLGPRQTGKTTLIKSIPCDLSISLMHTDLRHRYEQNPASLRFEVTLLAKNLNKPHHDPVRVFIDEIQLVPPLMNEIQNLIDEKTAQFILSGSSARKLKHQNHINILPGRVFLLYLDPLSDPEIIQTSPYDISYSLEDRLYFGSLPAITLEKNPDYRSGDLKTYVQTYLEDEVRREALVRNLAQFGRFLELAAAQSGEIINLTKLSQEIGVAHTTIANYYQILEDCLIVKRVDSYAHTKTRRRLTKSPKYLFFDLGVRRLAAREGYPVSTTQIGHLFEQWIGLELLKWINLHEASRPQLFFWRDNSGTEVDWVIKKNNDLIPIEVKWTEQPSEQDIKYLKIFIQEYECSHGYLVCRTPHALALTDKITAIPWASLGDYLN